jgi:hypothetical protein
MCFIGCLRKIVYSEYNFNAFGLSDPLNVTYYHFSNSS